MAGSDVAKKVLALDSDAVRGADIVCETEYVMVEGDA